jgi:hypothetical protein
MRKRRERQTDEIFGLVERKTASVLLAAEVLEQGEARFGGLAVDVRRCLLDDETAVVDRRKASLVEGEVGGEDAGDLVVKESFGHGAVGDIGFEDLAEEQVTAEEWVRESQSRGRERKKKKDERLDDVCTVESSAECRPRRKPYSTEKGEHVREGGRMEGKVKDNAQSETTWPAKLS